jgi:hypothetical protein
MKKYVKIESEEQLNEGWSDPEIPNMSFSFEGSIQHKGQLYGTYTPMILPSDWTITYHHAIMGNITKTIPAGTYGIHPNTVELD